jgi:hypothetical protein
MCADLALFVCIFVSLHRPFTFIRPRPCKHDRNFTGTLMYSLIGKESVLDPASDEGAITINAPGSRDALCSFADLRSYCAS